jgi:tetratricopeptide (TPR) repeat protein
MSEREDSEKAADQPSVARWSGRVARWSTKALSTLLFLCTGIVVLNVTVEVFGGSFTIDPISVPEEFAKKGISGETVSARIRDEMGRLESESRMGGEGNTIRAIVESNSTPEINVLGTSISVRYIADALRDMLPFRYQKFSGYLSVADSSQSANESDAAEANSAISHQGQQPRVKLVLRESHDSKPLFDEEGPYDRVVRDGALAALQVADPYPAAINLSRRRAEHAEALALIDRTLYAPSRGGWQSALAAFLPDKTVARGKLARAYVLMDMGKPQYDDARKAFEEANDEYVRAQMSYYIYVRAQAPYLKGEHWDAALDGLTVLDIYENHYDNALRDAELAKNTNPDYESAFYHSAQADDEHFRAFVSGEVRLDVCEAFARARDAQKKYDQLIKKNSTFGAAYFQEAIMLARELAYVLANGPPKCDSKTIDLQELAVLVKNGQELAGTINNLFDMGLARDPNFFNGWYEWGRFLIWLMDKPDIQPQDTSLDSIANAAIEKYDRAIGLVKTDTYLSEVNAYFWLRKAEALVRRKDLESTPDSLRRQLLAHAKSAYSTYGQLVANVRKGLDGSDESRIEAELEPTLGAVVADRNDGR